MRFDASRFSQHAVHRREGTLTSRRRALPWWRDGRHWRSPAEWNGDASRQERGWREGRPLERMGRCVGEVFAQEATAFVRTRFASEGV